MLVNMESVRTEYTIRYNVYSVRSWLNNSNVVTENLYWTTNLKRVKHKLKAVKKVYQDELKGIDLDNETREYIAEKFGCSETTVSRNKTRLLNKLKVRLVSKEVIEELFL